MHTVHANTRVYEKMQFLKNMYSLCENALYLSKVTGLTGQSWPVLINFRLAHIENKKEFNLNVLKKNERMKTTNKNTKNR